ncbi:MAG: right-handed parallel beta-helix repeat-containing protein, partial [Candidatus Heimdallarchaeota archaeon]|nr:right-handed parallel beta-helix repeat-containing protein [Candidatus Heimdallarchaeota archaeon]
MKKSGLKVSIMLILSLLILYSVALNAEVRTSSAETPLTTPSNQPSLEDLIVETPMIIDYDSDFESYGFPGDGSPGDPYRIENLNITTTEDYCLNFGGYTTKHFIIQNCFLKTDTNYAIYIGKYNIIAEGTVDIYNNDIVSTGNDGLKLDGVVNGKIRENYIVSISAALSLDDSNFTYVHNNVFAAYTGVSVINSRGVTILKNTCTETTDTGIHLLNANETIIAHNNVSN